jgi:hypothetical protein
VLSQAQGELYLLPYRIVSNGRRAVKDEMERALKKATVAYFEV